LIAIPSDAPTNEGAALPDTSESIIKQL
jgi:hypothetical protein